MLQRIWNGSCEDWLHGDEYLDDADDYAPMQRWEIDEALADMRGDDKWLEDKEKKL
jgi:hypothetical protein